MVVSKVSSQEILAQRSTAAKESQNMKVWQATNQFSLLRRNLHLEGLMISTEPMTMITRGLLCRLRKTNIRETWIRIFNLRLRSMDLEHHQVFMNRKAIKCSIFHRSNPQGEWLILGWTWIFKKINIITSITKYKDTPCLLHKRMMVKTLDSSTSEQASTMRSRVPPMLIGQVARSLWWKTSSLRLGTHHFLALQKRQTHQWWMTQDANQRDLISTLIH